ncbi:MAG: hypothetical protein K8S97_12380 [Anaerolineae bacterium]|nr:hypothetical protein [Anaerolineae bacterium]
MAHFGGIAGEVVSAIAAAAKERKIREEEVMTTYLPEELRDDWEFKIVRSHLEAFRNPQKLKRVIAEEARAGWVLVEKFDNGRLRFKRPASARANDQILPQDVDPYRTTFGFGEKTVVLLILGMTILLALGIILAVVFATGNA